MFNVSFDHQQGSDKDELTETFLYHPGKSPLEDATSGPVLTTTLDYKLYIQTR